MTKVIGSIRNGHIRKTLICTECNNKFSTQIWLHKNAHGQIVEFIPNYKKCQACRTLDCQNDIHIDIQTAILANSGKLNDLDLHRTKKHAELCNSCNAILLEVAMRIQSGQIKIDP